MTISIRDVSKSYGRYPALKNVSLEIAPGELLALLGPSGSGKTTLLRTVAGLEFPESGQVCFDGQDVTFTGAADRRVGFVFQQYALFKHMTIAKNVAFGLDVRKGKDKPSKADIGKRVDELLNLVELGGLGGRYPSQLSGGQRQRVALARALAVDPSVLLLDEPFGALDATVRKSLRKELRRIHDATGVTTVFVTHDQEEALELADRVAILNAGRIEQVGTPAEVYDTPAAPFVCGFVGEANRFEGRVEQGRFTAGAVTLPAPATADGAAIAFVRPHDFALGAEGLPGVIRQIALQGPLAKIEVAVGDHLVEVVGPRSEAETRHAGDAVHLASRRTHLYPG